MCGVCHQNPFFPSQWYQWARWGLSANTVWLIHDSIPIGNLPKVLNLSTTALHPGGSRDFYHKHPSLSIMHHVNRICHQGFGGPINSSGTALSNSKRRRNKGFSWWLSWQEKPKRQGKKSLPITFTQTHFIIFSNAFYFFCHPAIQESDHCFP